MGDPGSFTLSSCHQTAPSCVRVSNLESVVKLFHHVQKQ